MKNTFVTFMALASTTLASAIPLVSDLVRDSTLATRQLAPDCQHGPDSRGCWSPGFNIDTDYHDNTPNTGVTREYWITAENITLSADGYTRQVLAFNGTIPGPAIVGDWGDNFIIHVTNNMPNNGTAIHWHGLRQLNSVEYDGVPGVTQCPIAPGDTLTYRFQATQYGSTWYHSHFTLQYGDGLLGPMIINGPATANYDDDLGVLVLSDWSHTPLPQLWDVAKQGVPPILENGVINGTNTYDCSTSTDPNCVGGGRKNVNVFEPGRRYRYRLLNSALDSHFLFSIDGHNFQVIGMDLVPIVPYTTDSISIAIGQRYDIIVTANATPGDYWLRAGLVEACGANANAANITGIIRYDASSTADPTTTSSVTRVGECGDEPVANLVPHVRMDVGAYNASAVDQEELGFVFEEHFKWTLNGTSLHVNWDNPTTLRVFNNESIWPAEYNVQPLRTVDESDIWAVYVIEDLTGFGITHPIHLHGHDFWVISQGVGLFDDAAAAAVNLINPPRRDVASLPANGHLAMAFKKDNPGTWLLHCHIAWHASEGFAMQFVEDENRIALTMTDAAVYQDTCANWVEFERTNVYEQDDSGI
ncbi:hypothetical protein HYFRA_00004895 [Hymenoscyphus fraxineus]|uniref:laccase n=1 Tax=Hymenoscyphus fraxineus TaxID=746836 RepID=A0A9N9KKD7_9HELO|nr:hypothetical protein HYFRA_00004895 [Hymenoscyphus fraxineus]